MPAIPVVAAIGGSIIGAVGASSAAGAQAGAATNAANLQYQLGQQSLAQQQQQFNTTQQNIAPWLAAGRGGLSTLTNLLGIVPQPSGGATITPGYTSPVGVTRGFGAGGFNGQPGSDLRRAIQGNALGSGSVGQAAPATTTGGPGTPGFGSLLQGFNTPFVAPTAATEQNDPGYQFRLQQGEQALQNSAAAQGGLLSGNTLQAITNYGQNYASNEYANVYNRALTQYQQAYNIFQGNQTNTFNRLAALSGIGQTAASTLGQLGQQGASNTAYINASTGAQVGGALQNAGAATASGYAGIANALTSGIGGIGQYALLQQLLNQQNNGGLSNIPYMPAGASDTSTPI